MTPAYLAACAIYRDEATYLAEWIEFHCLVGFERFFLYDNFSEDEHRRVLRPYVREGLVSVQDWPVFGEQQRRAYDHCLGERRDDTRWIAFLDLDEFLFTPQGGSLPDVLADYEDAPAVCAFRREFSMSGHRTRPPGLVIESYLRAMKPAQGRATAFKSIVNPARAVRSLNAHAFEYRDDGVAVDERGKPMQPPYRDRPISLERLRVNHYMTKSAEEVQRKAATLDARGLPRPFKLPDNFERWEETEHRNTVQDEAILAYAPAVREALERRLPRAQALG
jgi:hypothetical protein